MVKLAKSHTRKPGHGNEMETLRGILGSFKHNPKTMT